jgi:effector-binding domain-containing protein
MASLHKVGVIAVAAALSFFGQASVAQTPPAPAAPVTPAPPPAQPPAQPPLATADPFGEEVMLTARTMVFFKGTATWDAAFDTLTAAFKSVSGFLEKQGVKASGPAMTVYLATDDTGFQFQAGFPVAEEPKEKQQGDIAVAKSPEGRALKFVHRGSYDAMESTYDAITNYLEEKQLESKDQLIEQYVTNPLSTAEDKLIIEVLVLIK